MKVTAVIVALLIVQAKASFFDDFAGALYSVQNSITKLLNDVATDMENTIHCTILAIEQALAVSGAISEPSTNGYNCHDRNESTNDRKYKKTVDNLKKGAVNDNHYEKLRNNISQQISSSISKVNNSLIHIINNGGSDSLKHIKKNYTNRLTEVGLLLRQELEKISHRVNNQFSSDNLSFVSLWNDMKILHNVERNDKNMSEVKEISQVLNEAVSALHLNTTSNIKSDDDKIEVIIRELEHDANNNLTFNSIDQELAQWKEERTRLLDDSSHIPRTGSAEMSEESPKSFKDLGTKLFEEKDQSREEMENTNESIIEVQKNTVSFEKLLTVTNDQSEVGTQSVSSKRADKNSAVINFESLVDGISKEDYTKAIDQANDIIKEHSRTEMMLDLLFAKQHESADVFDNPEKLDFGNFN